MTRPRGSFPPQNRQKKKPRRIAPAGLCLSRRPIRSARGLFRLAAFGALLDQHVVGREVLALHLAERIVAHRGFGTLRQFGGMFLSRAFGRDQMGLVRGAHGAAQRGILRSEELTYELQSLMLISYD